MTQLGLNRKLSYCTVDGHLIFLDVQHDRYFRLGASLEAALVAYLHDGDATDRDLHRLMAREILVDRRTGCSHMPPSIAPPTRSAMEDEPHPERTCVRDMLDTLAIVCSTRLQLKGRSLQQVLGGLVSLRGQRASLSGASSHRDSNAANAAAAAFRSARLYVPIDTCCLLDSIALVRFMAKRGWRADLVFGVTADPFSAHCWAQYGTTVLNDALGHALAHTPVRVV